MHNPQIRKLIRTFALEVLLYALLVVGYFFLVLRVLGEPLRRLFSSNLTFYALVSLALIVAQGAVLEAITSFLLNRLGIERLE